MSSRNVAALRRQIQGDKVPRANIRLHEYLPLIVVFSSFDRQDYFSPKKTTGVWPSKNCGLKDSGWVQPVWPEVGEWLSGRQTLCIPWNFPEQRAGSVFIINI